jgi:hypothetical protein
MRVRGLVALLLAVLVAPATAQAQTGGTAAAYPGNTISLEAPGPLVAGSAVKVKMSGHAQWNEPTDALTTPYSLVLFVADADIDPNCSPAFDEQRGKWLNLPNLNAANSSSPLVVNETIQVQPNPPELGLDWSIDSLPFAIRPGLDNVILCAYVRYIIDDVAWFQLPVTTRQPSCKAERATVRRGAELKLKCNVSGPATVRFSGPRNRTVNVKISPKDGRVRVPTGSLRSGRYRISVKAGDLALGPALRVRIR